MKKKALKKEEEINQILIPKLIYSIMGFKKPDPHYKTVEDFINNFLRNNSLMYIPKISEIKQSINGLYDKFQINSQSEKAKLIKDYIVRLETIFNSKNANLNYLFKFILVVIQLARSPLMNSVNIDIMREKFEERHIRLDANRIFRNKNFDLKDIKLETTVKFEPINYASCESSENEFSLNEENKDFNFNNKNNLYFNLERNIENNFKSGFDFNYDFIIGYDNVNNSDKNNKIFNSKSKSHLNTNGNHNIDDNSAFTVKKIEGYKTNKPVFDKQYKLNLFNMIIKDSKYHELVKDNYNNNNNNKNNILNLNLNEKEIGNLINFDKKLFHNSLKLEKQINLNSPLSAGDLEKNSKSLFDFYAKKLEEENFQFKNSFAFSNIINLKYPNEGLDNNDFAKKNLMLNFNLNKEEDDFFTYMNYNNNKNIKTKINKYPNSNLNLNNNPLLNPNKNERINYIESNFLLISVLNKLITSKNTKTFNDSYLSNKSFDYDNNNANYIHNNKNENNFENNFFQFFEKFYCLDLDKTIQNELISDLSLFNEKLLYLKNFGNSVKENDISSYVVLDFVNFVAEISKFMEFILNSYLKIALWQKGKLKNPIEAFLFDSNFLFYKKHFKVNSSENKEVEIEFGDLKDSNIFNLSSHFYSNNNSDSLLNENVYNNNNNKSNYKEYSKQEVSENYYFSFAQSLKNYLNNLKSLNSKSTFASNKKYFQRVLEEFHNHNITKYIDWDFYFTSKINKSENNIKNNFYNSKKQETTVAEEREEEKDFSPYKKLTLLNLRDDLVKFYSDKLDYLISIAENLTRIKNELDRINAYKPYLFVKEFIDFLYLNTKQIIFNNSNLKILLATEVFFSVIFSYLEIIQVFMLNGNLIDTFNEFFLDHIFTKKENAKIIFNFNEKFKNFDWFNSFKIKSYSLFDIEGGCVPEIFKNEQVNFKILETGKSVFLIKNLRSLDKINFEMNIGFESEKMKEIKEFVYKEIYKIVDLENIQNKNFEFYENFVLKKYREDNDIKKLNFDLNNLIAKLDQESNEKKDIGFIGIKENDFNNNNNNYFDENNKNKKLKRTNDLMALKKNIQINSEIELHVFKNLPYNLEKKAPADEANRYENLKELLSSNKINNLPEKEEESKGINFNFNLSITDAGNGIRNNQFNYKNIFNEEDTSFIQEDEESEYYKNKKESNLDLMDIEENVIIESKEAYNFKNENNQNKMDICDADENKNQMDMCENKPEKKVISESKANKKYSKKIKTTNLNNNTNKKIERSVNKFHAKSKNKITGVAKANNQIDFDNLEEINDLELFSNIININDNNSTTIKNPKESNESSKINSLKNNRNNELEIHKIFKCSKNSDLDLLEKTENPVNFSLDYLFNNEIIKRIKSINKTLNEKLLGYLIKKEKIKEHFELCFAILFFRAGFSMNIFVSNLLEFTQKGKISDNFFLKNLITEISLNSDLRKYHGFIRDFFFLSLNKDIVNNFDMFKIEYKPNLPISIFYDETVNTYYSAIFNFIFNIKRMNESFKLVISEKLLSTLQYEIERLDHKILPVNIFKKINFIKLNFCEIFNKVEFYIFYHCLNKKINDYLSLCHESQSIDALINSHMRLLKDIYLNIGVKENELIKNLSEVDTFVDHFKIIVNNFFNILSFEKDEFEQYRKLQENSIDVLEFSKNLSARKDNIEIIISVLIEKAIN